MQKIKQLWEGFVEKHPKLSVWVREGGLFILVSNLITIFKYLILTFLPAAFAFMGNRDFGFPGIELTLFGVEFKWYIIGYGAEQGGVSYFTAYMIALARSSISSFRENTSSAATETSHIKVRGISWRSALSPVWSTPSTAFGLLLQVALFPAGSTTLVPQCSMAVFRWWCSLL